MHGPAGQLDHGGVGEAAGQVAHRVRLADPRRTVEQQPPLEVLAGSQELLLVTGHPDDLTVQRGQRLGRQHQRLRLQHGPPVELQEGLSVPEDLAAEGQHLPSEDVVLRRQIPQPARELRCPAFVVACRLDRHRPLPRARVSGPDQQRDPARTVGHQVDRALHTWQDLPVRPGRDVDPGDIARPRPEGVLLVLPGEQLGKAELAMLEADDADDLVLDPGLVQPGVQRRLHVGMVVRRPRLLHHGERRRLGTQVRVQQGGQRHRLVSPRDPDQSPLRPSDEA